MSKKLRRGDHLAEDHRHARPFVVVSLQHHKNTRFEPLRHHHASTTRGGLLASSAVGLSRRFGDAPLTRDLPHLSILRPVSYVVVEVRSN
jgi:hypothetical protein